MLDVFLKTNIKQVRLGPKPHRSVSWSLQRAAGRKDSGSPSRQRGQREIRTAFPETPAARNRHRHTPPRAKAGTRPESPDRWRPFRGCRRRLTGFTFWFSGPRLALRFTAAISRICVLSRAPRRLHASLTLNLPTTTVREALAKPSPPQTVAAKPADRTQPLV